MREFAGSIAGDIFDRHFDEFHPVLTKWRRHASENVRRAVVIAAMEAAKPGRPGRGLKLLRLIEPLMADPARYVRVNLGPFAISLALLKSYPDETLKWLEAQSRKTDENVRWNVAMVWSAVGGASTPLKGRASCTGRRPTNAASCGAPSPARPSNWAARTDLVRPLVRKWRADSKRKHTAAVVAYYLK